MLVSLILIVLLLGFIGAGMKDGFIHTFGRLVGAVIGFLIARPWSIPFGSFLSAFLPSGWARLIAFILIFVVVTRLVGLVFKLADAAFHIISFIPFLKTINTLLGAIAGVAEGVIVLGGIIWVINTFHLLPTVSAFLTQSVVAVWIQKGFSSLLTFAL